MTAPGLLPPAGWYVDPGAGAQLRWWDGTTWTDHTAARAVPAPAPSPAPVGPARRRNPWPWVAIVVAGLLVGGVVGLATRGQSTASAAAPSITTPSSPKQVADRYYRPVLSDLVGDADAVVGATDDNSLANACGALHTDLRRAAALPAVAPDFDRRWSELVGDGGALVSACVGAPSGTGGFEGAYDRFTADATDVSSAIDALPG